MSKFSDGFDKIDWSKPVGRKVSAQPTNTKKSFMLQPKFDEFVSPIDKTVISCPGTLRRHNERHGVTNVRDYGEKYFERRGKEKFQEQQGASKEQRAERRALINRTLREKGI